MFTLGRVLAASLLLAHAFCRDEVAGTLPVIADTTATLPSITTDPSIKFREGVAGQLEATSTIVETQPQSTRVVAYTPVASLVTADVPSYSIPLGQQALQVQAMCMYPVSGYYDDLARWLFYATLAFALLVRGHDLLVIGALAASLTYSGSAAVHACVMVWSGQSIADTDMFAVLGLLALSASLLVPLLNWSTTIQNLGKDREEESASRTIIIYWALLIFLGFLSQFVLLMRIATGNSDSLAFDLIPWTSTPSITCSPPSGVLDLTVDQQQGWHEFYVTAKFIEVNACTNPCTGITDNFGNPITTLLRNPKDLVPVTAKQINAFVELANLSKKQLVFQYSYAVGFLILSTLALVWVIVQAMCVIFFGRRNPRQVRNLVYVRLTKAFSRRDESEKVRKTPSLEALPSREEADRNFQIKSHRFPSWVAKTIAFGFYMWAWSASVVSVLVAIIAIIANEYWMSNLARRDAMYQIDQWGPWVGTALILLVALVYRFQGIFEDTVIRSINWSSGRLYRLFHGRRPGTRMQQKPRQIQNRWIIGLYLSDVIIKRTGRLFRGLVNSVASEWRDLLDFLYRDPWNTAVRNQGRGHLRRRRAIAGHDQTLPDDWLKYHDYWLDVGDFVEAAKQADADYRQIHGHGYKWQPRVIKDIPLRAEFDSELFFDVFRGKGTPEVVILGPKYAKVPTMQLDEEMGMGKKGGTIVTVSQLYDPMSPKVETALVTMVKPPTSDKSVHSTKSTDAEETAPATEKQALVDEAEATAPRTESITSPSILSSLAPVPSPMAAPRSTPVVTSAEAANANRNRTTSAASMATVSGPSPVSTMTTMPSPITGTRLPVVASNTIPASNSSPGTASIPAAISSPEAVSSPSPESEPRQMTRLSPVSAMTGTSPPTNPAPAPAPAPAPVIASVSAPVSARASSPAVSYLRPASAPSPVSPSTETGISKSPIPKLATGSDETSGPAKAVAAAVTEHSAPSAKTGRSPPPKDTREVTAKRSGPRIAVVPITEHPASLKTALSGQSASPGSEKAKQGYSPQISASPQVSSPAWGKPYEQLSLEARPPVSPLTPMPVSRFSVRQERYAPALSPVSPVKSPGLATVPMYPMKSEKAKIRPPSYPSRPRNTSPALAQSRLSQRPVARQRSISLSDATALQKRQAAGKKAEAEPAYVPYRRTVSFAPEALLATKEEEEEKEGSKTPLPTDKLLPPSPPPMSPSALLRSPLLAFASSAAKPKLPPQILMDFQVSEEDSFMKDVTRSATRAAAAAAAGGARGKRLGLKMQSLGSSSSARSEKSDVSAASTRAPNSTVGSSPSVSDLTDDSKNQRETRRKKKLTKLRGMKGAKQEERPDSGSRRE